MCLFNAYLFVVGILVNGRGPSLPFYGEHRQNDGVGTRHCRRHRTSPFQVGVERINGTQG